MNEEYIHTDRLLLRKVDPERIHRLYTVSDIEEIKSFYGFDSIAQVQKEQLNYEKGIRTYNRSFLYFHLLDRQEEKVIGWCGYHTWYTEHDRAEIGYELFKEESKKQGLMTEAMQAILSYGFSTMDLQRVEAMIGEDNVASIRLVEKFGFQKEGRLRGHYKTNGVYEDSLIFGLLKEEF